MDPVELGADRPDEGGELGGVARRERLEVEVDAVGAAIADGGGDLAGEVEARWSPSRGARFWRVRPARVQPKLWTVSTTRVWLAWAAEMTLVILELVQPLQPTVVVPSALRFWRLPAASAPTPK